MAFGGQIFWSYRTVVDGRVVLCEVIGIVFSSRPPEVAEFLLGGAAAEPMEFNVHRFEAFACYVIGNNSKGCSIVSLHWRRVLWMLHFQERMALWDGLSTVDKEGAYFGFGRR